MGFFPNKMVNFNLWNFQESWRIIRRNTYCIDIIKFIFFPKIVREHISVIFEISRNKNSKELRKKKRFRGGSHHGDCMDVDDDSSCPDSLMSHFCLHSAWSNHYLYHLSSDVDLSHLYHLYHLYHLFHLFHLSHCNGYDYHHGNNGPCGNDCPKDQQLVDTIEVSFSNP